MATLFTSVRRWRRRWALALAVLLLLAAGCGGKGGTAGGATTAQAPKLTYAKPAPLEGGSQARCSGLRYKPGDRPTIAYMPPATEFNYYIAIGKGLEARAKELGADTFMLAPQSGNDINGQMGMIQDVLTREVDAIVFSTHDQDAAAPLIKRAVEQGIAVTVVNSDIPNFPTPVQAVVGYQQRAGTRKLGEWAVKQRAGKPTTVGILEGAPGYHSTERVGGFRDAIKNAGNFKVVASLNGNWNVDGGDKAATDMLQAHPDIQLIFAANDYEILGAAKAARALGMRDLILLGNDGDTNAGLEPIAAGEVTATVNTTPFDMGRAAMQVAWDCLHGSFPGGYVETPAIVTTKDNVLPFLCKPERLYPKPSKTYPCK
jgi:ribose transport system substrate-binding protein